MSKFVLSGVGCFFVLLSFFNPITSSASTLNDTLLRFEPERIEEFVDSTGFLQGYITIHNLSETDTLRIPQITPSCYCGMSTILNSIIPPKQQGRIYLAVNTKEFKKPLNSIEYKVYTSFTSKPVKLFFDCKLR
jgi:hypothetical protein